MIQDYGHFRRTCISANMLAFLFVVCYFEGIFGLTSAFNCIGVVPKLKLWRLLAKRAVLELIQMIQDTYIKYMKIFSKKRNNCYIESYMPQNCVLTCITCIGKKNLHCDMILTQKSKTHLPFFTKDSIANDLTSRDTPRTVYSVIQYSNIVSIFVS
jgi:hypothetical protein